MGRYESWSSLYSSMNERVIAVFSGISYFPFQFGACLKTSNWQRVNQLSCWEVNLNELSLNSYKKLISLESDSIKHLYNPEKGWQD